MWRGDAPEAERGFVALGTPIGHPQFADARLLEEARLLHELPLLQDLQCTWLLATACRPPVGHPPARPLLLLCIWRCLLAMPSEDGEADPEVAASRRMALLTRWQGRLSWGDLHNGYRPAQPGSTLSRKIELLPALQSRPGPAAFAIGGPHARHSQRGAPPCHPTACS